MSPQDLASPWYVDVMLVTIWLAMAFIQGHRIMVIGHSVDRWMMLTAWGTLSAWWTYRIVAFGGVAISAPSAAALLLIASASTISARKQIKLWRADIRCYQEPHIKCFREDRIKMILSKDP